MIGSEGIVLGVIKGNHADNSGQSLQRDRQCGTQSAELSGIVQISGFDGRITVNNRFAILRHPAGKALA